jgi:GGDEF domain-containing protein
LAQRIKNAVNEHFQGAIGLSLGLTHFDPQESPQQFFNRADRAAYAAKQAGGGRIVTA